LKAVIFSFSQEKIDNTVSIIFVTFIQSINKIKWRKKMRKTNLQLGSFVANVKMGTVCVKIDSVKIGKGGGGR
jgi:hypothetical protein